MLSDLLDGCLQVVTLWLWGEEDLHRMCAARYTLCKRQEISQLENPLVLIAMFYQGHLSYYLQPVDTGTLCSDWTVIQIHLCEEVEGDVLLFLTGQEVGGA